MKDVRGSEIEIGSIVAYNQSGALAVGKVVKIVPRTAGWQETTESAISFLVEPINTAYATTSNKLSKVRHAENLLVLSPSESEPGR